MKGKTVAEYNEMTQVGAGTIKQERPTIGLQLTRISEGLGLLDEVTSKLEQRLEPILLREDSDGRKESGEDLTPPQSILSEQLSSYADRIDRRIRQVVRILDSVNL